MNNSGDPNIGTVLNGRYRVIQRLGSGSHGNVYAGTQIGTERKVAIKLLRPESQEDPELEARFRREGLVMCNLKSAHTITTYDFDRTSEGTMYIIMELLEGRPLSDVIDEQAPLEWRRVVTMLGQICEALAEAHHHAIVHRDLKPANILVEKRAGQTDYVKVLDFGIAKLLHGESIGMDTVPKLTARGQTIGTLRYMSPEQLMGAPLDGRSDIYSLGVLVFELLTKSVPFPEATKPAKLIAAQLRQEPLPPSQVHPTGGIPASVDRMVLTMLAKEPDDRFADAESLLQMCEDVLSGRLDLPVQRSVTSDDSQHVASRKSVRFGTSQGPVGGPSLLGDDDDDKDEPRTMAYTAQTMKTRTGRSVGIMVAAGAVVAIAVIAALVALL